jgi:hypothetical protein
MIDSVEHAMRPSRKLTEGRTSAFPNASFYKNQFFFMSLRLILFKLGWEKQGFVRRESGVGTPGNS